MNQMTTLARATAQGYRPTYQYAFDPVFRTALRLSHAQLRPRVGA